MVQKLCERLLRKKKRVLRKALQDTAGRRTLEEVQKGLWRNFTAGKQWLRDVWQNNFTNVRRSVEER